MSVFVAILVVFIQIATGSIAILLIPSERRRSKFEIVGLGLALGTFASMLSSVLFTASAIDGVAWLLPSIAVLIVALWKLRTIRQHMSQLTVPSDEVIAVIVGLAVGGALIAVNWIRVPLSSIRAGGSVDMYFFEALSRGISQFGPNESILMSEGSLRYHWFTYGWAGELTQIAGLDPFVSLTRILPIVALVGVVFLAASWAGSMRFGESNSPRWVPSLAVLLIVMGGYTGALYGVVLNFDSPSQAFTTVWLLALVVIFISALRANQSIVFGCYLVLAFLLSAATTGGKASHVFVALGGFGLITIVGIVFRQPWWRRAVALFAATLMGAVLTFLLVLSGVGLEENLGAAVLVRASTWQSLDPVSGRWGPLLGTIALSLAVLARLAGSAWFARNRAQRVSPEFLFAVGAFGSGVLALFALRGGINDLWFLLAASAPIAVISAYGVGQAQNYLRSRLNGSLLKVIFISIVASGVSLVLSLNWTFSESPLDFFAWPGILFWLSIVLVWVVIFILAFIFGRTAQLAFGIAICSLVLTSLFTRPAVLWTESRTLTTEIGVVTPNAIDQAVQPNAQEVASALSDQFEAAAWLAKESLPANIVATNAPWSAFIPALSGHKMYLAGEAYQSGLGAVSDRAEITRRSALSRGLTSSLNESQIQELCSDGVAFIWLEGTRAPTLIDQLPTQEFGQVSLIDLREYCSNN